MVPTSYEGLDNDEVIETVSTNNNNNYYYYYMISDSESDEEAKEDAF